MIVGSLNYEPGRMGGGDGLFNLTHEDVSLSALTWRKFVFFLFPGHQQKSAKWKLSRLTFDNGLSLMHLSEYILVLIKC